MAHKKAGGSCTNGRDSAGQRLGVKCFSGEIVPGGSILIRQRGTKFKAGSFVVMGKDNSLVAKISGKVHFSRSKSNKLINIIPQAAPSN